MKKTNIVAVAIFIAVVGGIMWSFQPQQELLSACIAKAQCGYVNEEGKSVIAPEFEAAGDWVKDAGRVWRGGRLGSIDRSGRFITAPRYTRLSFNAGGGYSVELNNKQLMTDYALRPLNSKLWDDLKGIKLDRRLRREPEYIVIGSDNLFGLADGKGKVILEPKYQEIGWRGAHEFPLLFKEHYLFGHLSENGRPISTERWSEAGPFYNRRANVTQGGKCGYTDPTGRLVIPLAFDECRPFIYSEATIVRRGSTFSLINRDGVTLRGGLAEPGNISEDGKPVAVRVQDKWGAIDMKGNFAIPANFDRVDQLEVFSPEPVVPLGPKTVAYVVKIQNRLGIMNAAGNWILRPSFAQIDNDYNGDGKLATFRDGSLWGFVDIETGKATPMRWDEIKATTRSALIPVRDSGKWGYADVDGNMQIPARFDRAGDFHGDWASVQIGEKWGFINSNGARVTPPVFRAVGDVTPERARVTLVDSRGWLTRKGKLIGISEEDVQKAGLKN